MKLALIKNQKIDFGSDSLSKHIRIYIINKRCLRVR